MSYMQGTQKTKMVDHVPGTSDPGNSTEKVKKSKSTNAGKRSKESVGATVRRKGIRRQYRSLSDDTLGKRLAILEQRTLRAQDKFSRANDCWQKLLAEQRFRSSASPTNLSVECINDCLSEVDV